MDCFQTKGSLLGTILLLMLFITDFEDDIRPVASFFLERKRTGKTVVGTAMRVHARKTMAARKKKRSGKDNGLYRTVPACVRVCVYIYL